MISDFIYLNPKIHVDCNLYSYELAQSFLDSYQEVLSLSNIPASFSPNVYLNNLTQLTLSKTSETNQYIYRSLLLEGLSSNIVNSMGTYTSLIHKDIYLISNNTFSTGSNFSTLDFSSNEKIYMLKDNISHIYTRVVDVIDNNTFTVDGLIDDTGSAYKLLGIYLYDCPRLASIKYLTYSNEISYYSLDTSFNYKLYKTLYPELIQYDNERLYIDYIQNYPNRLGKTDEICRTTISSNVHQYQDVYIHNKLNLNFNNTNGYLLWNNLRISDISQVYFVIIAPANKIFWIEVGSICIIG